MLAPLVLISSFGLSLFLVIISVMAFKAWRKRDDRRSPLRGKKLANLPGQQLMTRVNEHGDELIIAAIVMYLSIPMMLFAWSIARVPWKTVSFGINEAIFAIFGVLMFAGGLLWFIRNWDARNRARDGLVAEQMTGQLLNRLIGPNCIVAHDLPCEGFNIDHIVIAPRAVYAVETKSFRKARGSKDDSHYKVTFDGDALFFPGWRDDKAIAQARRQAHWLARQLRESGIDVPVIPAVALPGWWIDRAEAGRRSDVRVFTPMGDGPNFLTQGREVLDSATRALVAKAIALRYPEISG